MRRHGWAPPVVIVATVAVLAAACSSDAGAPGSSTGGSSSPGHGSTWRAPTTGYLVYWDNNEEVDYYESADGSTGQLMPPWDLNGQICLLNDGTGRWVGGYDPTLPSQHNPGGPPHHPYKQPADGEEMNGRDGLWTGLNLYVPGPFKMPPSAPGVTPSSPGGDSPPNAQGVFNNGQTYTGCGVDRQDNVFGADIGTAQGQFPIPSSGRLVEWFAPSYRTYCILYGPTTGGVDGAHHTDGSGGLVQPGMMSVMPDGSLLLPEGGGGNGLPPGDVLEFHHSSFPTSASECPDGVYPRDKLEVSVFFQGSSTHLPLPQGIAFDPTCSCYAVGSMYAGSDGLSIAWVGRDGKPIDRPGIRGETLAQFGRDPSGFNPFGLAFAPDGTLYFVDIHIVCTGSGFSDCGTGTYEGRVLRVTFAADGRPGPIETVASGFDFPTSVTTCVPRAQICPFPTHRTPPPSSGPGSSGTG